MRKKYPQIANRKGAALLVAIIIISAMILVMAIGLGLGSISENQITLYQSQSIRVLQNIDGCSEEALTRMNRNSLYTGESLTLNNTSCIISVVGSGSTRTITVTATSTNYAKTLQINVSIFPTFQITSWTETI